MKVILLYLIPITLTTIVVMISINIDNRIIVSAISFMLGIIGWVTFKLYYEKISKE